MRTPSPAWLVRSACLILWLMLAMRTAGADPPTETTVLVLSPEGTPLAARLEAELGSLGFRVLRAEARDVTRTDLEEQARAVGAAVALSTRETARGGVELWLVDRVTGKTLLREVLERDLESKDPDAVIALRAVELLRASLLELELAHPPRGEVPAAPELRESVEQLERVPTDRRPSDSWPRTVKGTEQETALIAGVAMAAHSHLGNTRTMSGIAPVALWHPTGRLAAGFWGLIPLGSAEVSAEEGAVGVRSWAAGSGFRFAPFSLGSRFLPSFGAGAAVLWLNVEGLRARPDLALTSAELVAAGPYGELGCGLRVAGGLVLRADARALVAFPRPVIEFAGREIIALGRPLASLSFGVEYRAVLAASRD